MTNKQGWFVWVLCDDGVYRLPISEQDWKDDQGGMGEKLEELFGGRMLGWQVLEQAEPYGEEVLDDAEM